MNFKFNIWTILFLIASGLLAWRWNGAPAEAGPAAAGKRSVTLVENTPCTPTEINSQTGQSRINAYQTNWAPHYNADTAAYYRVGNPNVRYFKLAPCELQQMLAFGSNDAEVFAELALNPAGTKEGVDTIDLIFKVFNPSTQVVKYYDFTEPCPPMCPPN